MTLIGICGRCAEQNPSHVPHERRRLTRGPDGEKLCPRHAKEAWNDHESAEIVACGHCGHEFRGGDLEGLSCPDCGADFDRTQSPGGDS